MLVLFGFTGSDITNKISRTRVEIWESSKEDKSPERLYQNYHFGANHLTAYKLLYNSQRAWLYIMCDVVDCCWIFLVWHHSPLMGVTRYLSHDHDLLQSLLRYTRSPCTITGIGATRPKCSLAIQPIVITKRVLLEHELMILNVNMVCYRTGCVGIAFSQKTYHKS